MMKQEHRKHGYKNPNVGQQSVMFSVLAEGISLVRITGLYLLVFIWLISLVTSTYGSDIKSAIHKYSDDSFDDDNNPSVCQSKDIRNSVEMFSELQGCKVVEGFVQIVLIDKAEAIDYLNVSFPELREITGYLLLYRVQGLRTLGQLFPNLTVIRGNTLFLNYALVVYEMLQLQDIGLISLTNILRGAVYFAKNPVLCFVETIDWDIIASHGKGEHHIMGNKKSIECPLCPQTGSINQSCPKHAISGELLCWNMNHCQKSCPSSCFGTCNIDGDCCHLSCLGGCISKNSDSCFACKNFSYNNECMDNCPGNTFEYLNRRCITDSECYEMPKPREIVDYNIKTRPWKPFKGKCVLECPPGFLEKESIINGKLRATCEKCRGICKKECPGINVDSIATIQKLRGCTSIKGPLEIQIRGGNMVRELEDNLNTIEEIDDYLKIVRSFPIISLNFLPKLKEIHGYKLESSKYALVVLDNQNLAELWDWKRRSIGLKIDNGRLFFHFNPKLCLDKIEDLRKKANMPVHTDLEVASNSNGDKTACNIDKLIVKVYKKTSVAALIKWRQFENHDPRTLLGYVVYSIEAPHRNISIYDARDACGDDGWRVDDVSVGEDSDVSEEKEFNYILTQLKPYTQYAFYVKTYTIATETRGAQSPIQYFRTEPYIPSEPRSITIYSNSSSELVLHWKPPFYPNGNVTHYIVTAEFEPDNDDLLDQRNYCLEPLMFPDTKRLSVKKSNQNSPELNDKNISSESDTCFCTKKLVDNKLREKEIHFEDHLQNQIYIKRVSDNSSKDKRAVTILPFDDVDPKIDENELQDNYDVNGVYLRYHQIVYGDDNSFVIRNLRHFSLYKISIQACREWEEDEDKNKLTNCSNEGIIAGRTLPLNDADNIDSQQVSWEVSNSTHGIVKLKWDEPPNPNSMILTYQVEYWRSDIENYKPTVECISRNLFKSMGNYYVLKNLSPGNYSLRIRATSLSGNGHYTKINYFYIEEGSVSPVLQTTIIVIVIMLFIFIIIIPFIVFYVRRHIEYDPNIKLIASVNPEYVPSGKVYTPDDWEVPRENVKLIREIGQGSFGMVYEGILKTTDTQVSSRCAVKTVSCNSKTQERDRIEFLNEASVMKAFNTHHVVKLLGVVSQGQPTLVIMELMAHGDLKAYLRSCRPDSGYFPQTPPSLKDTLRMAVEIADGMTYLAAKKFVHRDLAARNCMVTEELTVKIGDFGMTRDIYETEYYRKGSKGLLPVRWMAPECLKDGVFSSLSDVWSYGVVLYEMATLASQPYQGLSNEQVLKFVIDGGVMDRPDNCPDALYHVMLMCWQQKPRNRPSFMNLVGMLKEHSNPDFASISFYDSEEGQEIRGIEATEETPLFVSRPIEDFSLSDDESCNPIKNLSNTGDEDELDDADDYGDISLKNTNDSWVRSVAPHDEDFDTSAMPTVSTLSSTSKYPGSSKMNSVDAQEEFESFEIPSSSLNLSTRSNGRITPNGCIKYKDVKTTEC